MAGREKRKRRRKQRRMGSERRSGPAAEPVASEGRPGATAEPIGDGPAAARPKSKDDVARESLEPLEEGERPLAVAIGAVLSAVLGLTTIVLFAAGVDTGEADFSAGGTLLYAAVMLVMAWGMWTLRYWAVLGFQALLALLIIIWSLLLARAESVLAALVAIVVVAIAGTLFWALVKSLARIQMPERRRSE